MKGIFIILLYSSIPLFSFAQWKSGFAGRYIYGVNKIDSFPDGYFAFDSVNLNFTPVRQNIAGWQNIIGNPSDSVINQTAVMSDGRAITINTINTSLWAKSSDSTQNIQTGFYNSIADPYPSIFPSSVDSTSFINQNTSIDTSYNLKISGLIPNSYYSVQIASFVSFSNNVPTGYPDGNILKVNNYNLFNHLLSIISNSSKFDTILSDAGGNIQVGVNGYVISGVGHFGMISGMKIYGIEKSAVSNKKNEYFFNKNHYRQISVFDGSIWRKCLLFMPFNYSPSNKYPLIVSLNGNESEEDTATYGWRSEFGIQYNIGRVIEQEHGNFYGLSSNGDTVRYAVLIPEYIKAFPIMDTGNLNALINNFISSGYINYNDSLYITGFSSGAYTASKYTFTYPYKVTGALIISPAFSFGTGDVTNLPDSAISFAKYGHKLYFLKLGDAFEQYEDTMINYLPDSSYYWASIPVNVHLAPTSFFRSSDTSCIYHQNLYDFFADPSRFYNRADFFSLNPNISSESSFIITDSVLRNPWTVLFSASDTTTGARLTTIRIADWQNPGSNVGTATLYGNNDLYTMFLNNDNQGNGFSNSTGTWQTNGYDLLISGLDTSFTYDIYMSSFANGGVGAGLAFSSVYTIQDRKRTDSIVFNNTQNINTTAIPHFSNLIPNSDGTIKIGVYPNYSYVSPGNVTWSKISNVTLVYNYRKGTSNYAPHIAMPDSAIIVQPDKKLFLNANASDIDDTISSYKWSVISSPSGTNPLLSNVNLDTTTFYNVNDTGIYKINLTVTNSHGKISSKNIVITIKPVPPRMAVGDRILIDLTQRNTQWNCQTTTSPQPDGRYWNNTDGPRAVPYANFVDSTGKTIDSVAITGYSGFSAQAGIYGGGNTYAVGQYPISAVVDGWETNNAYNDSSTFSMLFPAGTFTVKFWGNFGTTTGYNTIMSMNNGLQRNSMDVGNNQNYNNALIFTVVSNGITPITFNMLAGASLSGYAYINVIDISKISDDQ